MRYLPLNEADRAAMLDKVGATSIEDLFIDVPEEDGWFFKMTVSDKSELDGLMDAAAYKSFCDGL